MFLSNYLDVNNHSDLVVKAPPIFSDVDLNVFFLKKKIQRYLFRLLIINF